MKKSLHKEIRDLIVNKVMQKLGSHDFTKTSGNPFIDLMFGKYPSIKYFMHGTATMMGSQYEIIARKIAKSNPEFKEAKKTTIEGEISEAESAKISIILRELEGKKRKSSYEREIKEIYATQTKGLYSVKITVDLHLVNKSGKEFFIEMKGPDPNKKEVRAAKEDLLNIIAIKKRRIFDQVMKIWVNPEIEVRIKNGWLKKGTKISRIQVVFFPGSKPKVRFNERVYVTGKAKADRRITKGDEVKITMDNLEGIEVKCPPNCGHIALINLLGRWFVIFDARYYKKRIAKFIEKSKEFYESAKDDLKNGRSSPFFENCWASAELSSVCHFLSLGQEYEDHTSNIKRFEKWAELKNVNGEHGKILSRLNVLRKSARYGNSADFKKEDPKRFLKAVKEMIEEAEKLIRD